MNADQIRAIALDRLTEAFFARLHPNTTKTLAGASDFQRLVYRESVLVFADALGDLLPTAFEERAHPSGRTERRYVTEWTTRE